MAHPLTSKKRAKLLSTVLFLIGLTILIFTEAWWPGIMLAVGFPLALRQFLMGRSYDMAVSLLVFVGTYVTVAFDISWRIFLPALLTLGAFYILVREWSESNSETEEEKDEDVQHEIEEEKDKKHQ